MNQTLLPAAIKGDRRVLRPEALEKINQLSGARPGPFTQQLIGAWVVIMAAIMVGTWVNHWAVTALCVYVVASRQHVLGLLIHDQTHLLGYRHKYGDWVVDFLAGFPLLAMTVKGYAQMHLSHHRNYFTDSDPDYFFKQGEDWSTPMPASRLVKLFLMDAFCISGLMRLKPRKKLGASKAFARRNPVPVWVRPVYMVLAAVLLTVTHGWTVFLIYWLLPLLTIIQVILRWGALCEHKYNLPLASVKDSTPLIIPSRLNKILLPNLNFSLHAYHHFFPNVAFSELPQVHQIFEDENLIDHRHVFHGNLAYLRYITQASREAVASKLAS